MKKESFDANIGYVCHMTACYIFVGIFVVIGSVSGVVRVNAEYMFCTFTVLIMW
jgi:hypothetical protein